MIYIYDTTLRDGGQTRGISFSVKDKIEISKKLDEFGVDYIEAGWPGSNSVDTNFFNSLPQLSHSKFISFGMTSKNIGNDNNNQALEGLNALANPNIEYTCIVGKGSLAHVTNALNISRDANLEIIEKSILHLQSLGVTVFFDAEHFFDGYKIDPSYSIEILKTAQKAGVKWITLCDTNGGTLPWEIYDIISDVKKHIEAEQLGIHCHNDTGNAVANSLMAVRAGVHQIQGTINGIGEKCGNANLTSIIPTLILKMGYKLSISKDQLQELVNLSHFVNDKINFENNIFAPYVGIASFSHKAGLHVSAINKNPSLYEHISPEDIGNTRNILVSNQSGRSNILYHINHLIKNGHKLLENLQDKDISNILKSIEHVESQGYSYENCDASLTVLIYKVLNILPKWFSLSKFEIHDKKFWDPQSNTYQVTSFANILLSIENKSVTAIEEGNGPVNALNNALKQSLKQVFDLENVHLADYKVRIINSKSGTSATTRVLIDMHNAKENIYWTSLGVSSNIINASYDAIQDGIIYFLIVNKLCK